eukprot:TRINITY_DN58285_c0_g1_i1.p3 TRINITY_DN58285_c0_g1~~TRINITY_DN58285_c0_g1_i1.p3  ORF type:complete len:101 (-),score=23.24 TRINITY_DN58285_c0_g1_i1:20-322(-)
MKTAVAFLVCALAASAQGMVRSNSVFYQLLSGAKMSDEQMSMMMAEIEDESNEQGCEQWPDFGCEGIKVQRAHHLHLNRSDFFVYILCNLQFYFEFIAKI